MLKATVLPYDFRTPFTLSSEGWGRGEKRSTHTYLEGIAHVSFSSLLGRLFRSMNEFRVLNNSFFIFSSLLSLATRPQFLQYTSTFVWKRFTVSCVVLSPNCEHFGHENWETSLWVWPAEEILFSLSFSGIYLSGVWFFASWYSAKMEKNKNFWGGNFFVS